MGNVSRKKYDVKEGAKDVIDIKKAIDTGTLSSQVKTSPKADADLGKRGLGMFPSCLSHYL